MSANAQAERVARVRREATSELVRSRKRAVLSQRGEDDRELQEFLTDSGLGTLEALQQKVMSCRG